ncbi:MAG: hypothetical protein UZ14_CFX002000714 [Chloroflexi bacterium OLB14]|nr:MAG: hypothetical protein UZ14_CFX002000714 [Chloroflexi bacterium OLB14]
MPIRSLDFLDLPIIAKYRNDVLTLDSGRAVTRGHPLGAMGLLAYINPARHLYAAIANGDDTKLLGGIIHTRGETFAKLLYLAPSSKLDNSQLPELIEHLSKQAGEWKALHVIAEIDENNYVFPALRTAGFSVYAWQRLWDVTQIQKTESTISKEWRRVQSIDIPAVQNLHYQIVPQLLHPIEPAPNRVNGFVHEDLKCFANITSGMYGVMLTPLIHPAEENATEKIISLIKNVSNGNRKIYLNVRSYQTWLEPVLEDLGAKASQRQAVMVKHLVRLVKDGKLVKSIPSHAGVQPSQMSRMEIDE